MNDMELELHLDGNGRTTFDKEATKSNRKTSTMDYSSKTIMTNLVVEEETNKQQASTTRNVMDDLLYDCEIADCALLPRTFWVPATARNLVVCNNNDGDGHDDSKGFVPRCKLEQMALQVFQHHVLSSSSSSSSSLQEYDPQTSGAEWWVQLRPSPPGIGRYAVLEQQDKEKRKHASSKSMASQSPPPKDMTTSGGISFHWDKDEELRLLKGGTMFIHPHVSTVTYLSGFGAPTMALNCRINSVTGEWIPLGQDHHTDEESQSDEKILTTTSGYISWPKQGKHLSFDGRFLHAAPSDLMTPGEFEKQCQIKNDKEENDGDTPTTIMAKRKRRHRRVTFLVNIWLNYKPMDVHEFPESMLDKLSPAEPNFQLFPSCRSNNSTIGKETTTTTMTTSMFNATTSHKKNDEVTTSLPYIQVLVKNSQATFAKTTSDHEKGNRCRENDNSISSIPLKRMTWPLGGCDTSETLSAEMPLDLIQKESKHGGNILIEWKPSTDRTNNTDSLGITLKTTERKNDNEKCKKQNELGVHGEEENFCERQPKRVKKK